MSTAKLTIGVMPRSSNPYYDYLYQPIRRQGHRIVFISELTPSRSLNLILLPFELAYRKLAGMTVVHLHWTYAFIVGDPRFWLFRWLNLCYAVLVIVWTKLLGHKFIYTLHNLLPHNRQTANDIWLLRFVIKSAHRVIVLSRSALSSELIRGFPADKFAHIPIGPYRLSAPKSHVHHKTPHLNLLFFGAIDKYKGVDYLLSEFVKIDQKQFPVRLVIAGKPVPGYHLDISAYQNHPNIKLDLNFIPDAKLLDYLNQADAVVLPFISVTNSSSVALAFSYAKPVIAPLLGCISDLPTNTGIYYSPGSLVQAIQSSFSSRHKLFAMGKAGYKYIQSQNWTTLAESTLQVYGLQ